MEEKEYLLEWPPPSTNNDDSAPSPKRIKMSCEFYPSNSHLHLLETDIELTHNDSFDVSTRSLLARWWKRNKKGAENNLFELPDSKNPNTLMQHIAKHPSAKEFLNARITFLLSQSHNDPLILQRLSECHYMLDDIDTALHYIEEACKTTSECNKEMSWQLAIVKRQHDVKEKQKELQKQIRSEEIRMPQPMHVERRDCNTLSYCDFMREYASPGVPVVITGLQLTQNRWTLDYLNETIGNKVVPLRQPVAGSVEWARLESGGECRVRDYILDIRTQKNINRYLFDWSLPLNAPELANELTIPSYFKGDLVKATHPGTLYRDSWPSLFVSPSNITSSLHVDAFGSNFWMALFEGRKRWLFFPPEDLPCLYPLYTHSLDPVFEVDPSDPHITTGGRYPLLSLTHPRECVLYPGEVLFVPAGSPHQVDSLDVSVAISANYIDVSNIKRSLEELTMNALTDPRAGELLDCLKKNN